MELDILTNNPVFQKMSKEKKEFISNNEEVKKMFDVAKEDQAFLSRLAKMDNIRIKYACDIIKEKAEATKEKFDFVEQVITDYKVALEDSEVEAVFVLTPNYAHYTVTMDALRAGKHVF